MKAEANRKLPTLIILALLAVLIVGTVIAKLFNLGSPTKETVNLSEYYQAEAGKAAVIVNGKLTNVRAAVKNQQIYLRLGLVTEQINSHFYYEAASNTLFYTTAEEIFESDSTALYESSRIFYDVAEDDEDTGLTSEDRIYVLLPYIEKYTNIEVEYFSNPSRVFIRSKFGDTKTAKSVSGAALRTGAGNDAPVIAELGGGQKLWVISSENGWNKVYAGEGCGHAGYITDNEMTDVEAAAVPNKYIAPEYKYNLLDEKVCLVWHQVFSDSGVNRLDNLLKNASKANVVSPTWFSVVSSDGTIESRANKKYVKTVKGKGLQIWGLVENFNTENTLDYSQLLERKSSRSKMIEKLVSEVKEYDLDGINVDFEGLPSGAGEGYRQFIRELSIACHKEGIILSVDCYVPSAWTSHYYRADLSEAVDYFIVMAYDEHYDGSDAGSTSSIGFIESALSDTIAEDVEADRLICAIPFYSRLWKGEGSTLSSSTIDMEDMKEFMSKYSNNTRWDETSEQYYVSVTIDGVTNRLWVEDEKSIGEKLSLIESYDATGIACWKLGMDNAGVWDVIGKYLDR